jgi:hypothetical protein
MLDLKEMVKNQEFIAMVKYYKGLVHYYLKQCPQAL